VRGRPANRFFGREIQTVRSLSFWREAGAGGIDATRALALRAGTVFHDYVWNERTRALWMPWAMIALKICAVVAVFLYLGMAALLYFTQRSMMYFPDRTHSSPTEAGLPEAQEVELKATDGEYSLVWHIPPRGDRPVVLYFHGNGGALRYRIERFRKLMRDGIGLVALEYRGFGGNGGTPTEAGLTADAEAAYAFAASRYQESQIVVWGESLGTGLAVAVAAEKPVGRVILEAPFTSAAAVAAERYWYMPVRLLMKDQFRSDERIGGVKAPVLILHGARDHVVPFAMGERMFELTTARKHIVRFLDGDHEDLDAQGALHAVGRFLAGDLDKPPGPPHK
jgi:alpha-beta hydrolase superfamily lysophospholipase